MSEAQSAAEPGDDRVCGVAQCSTHEGSQERPFGAVLPEPLRNPRAAEHRSDAHEQVARRCGYIRHESG